MFDIYTDIDMPLWLVLFIQTTGLPYLQAFITKLSASGSYSKVVTIVLNIVAALAMLVASGSFDIADLAMLAAPGVFISSNAYDKVWRLFRIREWLKPDIGIGDAAPA